MIGKVSRILLTESQISNRIAELGEEISRDYSGKQPVAICLLKGSLIFTSDLVRALSVPVTVEFMRASSYADSTESSGSVKILLDMDHDITGKDVLIIEDIVDTGRTLAKTLELLQARHPKSLKICTLLDKPERRVVPVDNIAYTGFTIPNEFVVGYGLDYNEHYRDLPYVGVLDLDAG